MGIDYGPAIGRGNHRIGPFQQHDGIKKSRSPAGALKFRFDSRNRLFTTEKTLEFTLMWRDHDATLRLCIGNHRLKRRRFAGKTCQCIRIEHHVALRTERSTDRRPHRGTDPTARAKQNGILARIGQKRGPMLSTPNHDRIERRRMGKERLLGSRNRDQSSPYPKRRPRTEPCRARTFDAA